LQAAVALLVVAHAGLVFRNYPLTYLREERVLCSGDLSLRYAACFEGRELAASGGGLWGYSPYFMAGYPFGAWDSIGRRGDEYFGALLPFLSLNAAFYWYIVLAALLTPLLIWGAAAVLGYGPQERLLCLCVAILVFQVDNVVSYFWTFGNVVFPFVCSLGVLFTALLAAALERRSGLLSLIAGLTLALLGWMHPVVVLPVFISSGAVLYLLRRQIFRGFGWVYPLLAAGVGLLLLFPWLRVLLKFADYRVPQITRALESGWKYFVMDIFSDRAYRHHFDRRVFLHVEMVLFGLGCYHAWRRSHRGVVALATGAIAAFVFTYAFEYVSALKETEPYRFIVAFALFAAIPAALGAQAFWRYAGEADRAGRTALFCLGLVLLPGLTGYSFDILRRKPAGTLGTSQTAVLEWLRRNAHHAGRVLCEDEVLGNVLPAATGHEVIGGWIARRALLKHKVTWLNGKRFFDDDTLWREPLTAFEEYLRLYNIGYIVTRSARYTERFLQMPGWSLAFSAPQHTVYACNPAGLSYVWGGEGPGATRVQAGFNRLRVTNAPAVRFVLKYHYLETLTAPAQVRLFPVWVDDDPVPFIGVNNLTGLSAFEIENGG